MKKLFIVLAILALCAGTVSGKLLKTTPVWEQPGHDRDNIVVFYDDIEGDVSAWGSADLSAGATPHFHIDTYMAFSGSSWWCGNFDYDADGGYGNSWDDRLNIPTTDLTGATYPILTYAFRHDSEIGYDFTYVQAESMGAYVNLNRGYDGSAGWTDIGIYGFILASYDNPLNARFRFQSDGAWSDEDGLYTSVGGGFACDNVKVFDYFTGYVYFFDNADDEVHLVPGVPSSAGDWWHVIDRLCPAYSDPHSWWCGDDADTNLVPGNLQDALFSPLVDISGASACTAKFAMHFGIPQVDNDYVALYGTADGANYHGIASYWGDFEQCDGWGTSGFAGFDIGQFDDPADYSFGGFAWIMYTTDNGCGPAVNNGAGIVIDDYWLEVPVSPVEESSWGNIKAIYR